jgi:apolipoprotein D and lipocalin family protein
MRIVIVLAILSAVMLVACNAKRGPSLPPPEVVPSVDLARYTGTWYEIASYPNRFQKSCSETSATYTLLPTRDGKADSIKGTAKVVDPATNARIKVTFFWPFSGDYWIIELGAQYEYAVVSNPDRSYLWVLSRTPRMDEGVYAGIVERLRSRGFDTGKLARTVQTGS